MYNLLVRVYDPSESWDGSNRFTLERGRIFEYTDEHISLGHREDLQGLRNFPCLFAYERFEGTARIGRIDSLIESGRDVEIIYNFDTRFSSIPIPDQHTCKLFGFEKNEWYRTHWAVKNVDLFEIVAELLGKRSANTDLGVGDEVMSRLWGDQSRSHCRVFLSHRTEDKSHAAKVADELTKLGHRTFVAHQDISPTREWRDEIVHALNSMTHFVALITNDFHGGGWTDQEIGYAFGRKEVKRVFVKLSKADPKGLAGFEQAINPRGSSVAEHIHDVMMQNAIL